MLLDIKPLSVNCAWQGKRYKTQEYKRYEIDVIRLLRPFKVPEGKLELTLTFGFSSHNADIDNPVKCFVDILQKRYGFNDRLIKRLIVEAVDVEKNKEFIKWDLQPYKALL